MQRTTMLPEDYRFNLSDFAFFLSVMKNPKAYQSVLSIIMDEPDIEIKEVKVEQKGDDIRKRSRFYQGLLDAPILKSGKKTKYKMLPSTVIIFITQEDIFGRNLAKYTFTEQCEEVSNLKLEDGTTKIFLNMSSKNGAPELISMLQYMKDTYLENPDIIVKDSRLLELDRIVSEVRESDEWEAVKMNILEIGKEIGKEFGAKEKLKELIQKKLKRGYSLEEIADMLEEELEVIQQLASELGEK